MKLITYLKQGKEQLALLVRNRLFDANAHYLNAPDTMKELLERWDIEFPRLLCQEAAICRGDRKYADGIPYETAQILAPVPFPASCRDGYAFRQHVAAARRNRKVEMIPQFDQYPVFYFTNHHSLKGSGEIACMPDHFERLDFELEVAIVICRQGRNIKAEDADEYIGGLMIMNDLSARCLQMEEMMLNLGPAKGKDFATAVGPWLVTTDELQQFEIEPKEGHTGKNWNLKMTCKVNGVQVSEGNVGDMDWTFAEIIERVSYGADIFPGDVIGSGTVGSGCFLELNGTGKLNDPSYQERWLQEGDIVEMQIDQLGTLTNTIVAEKSEWSILKRKKNYDHQPS